MYIYLYIYTQYNVQSTCTFCLYNLSVQKPVPYHGANPISINVQNHSHKLRTYLTLCRSFPPTHARARPNA